MSADGVWKITVNTPMGARTIDATIRTSGETFTGSANSDMGSQEITGQVNGDTLTWSANISQPMPLKLDFEAKVDGDRMTGTVKLGMFGSAPINGERVG